MEVVIYASAGTNWDTRACTCYLAIERSGAPIQRLDTMYHHSTDACAIIQGITDYVSRLPEGISVVVRTGLPVGIRRNGIGGKANNAEKLRLYKLLVSRECPYRFEMIAAGEAKYISRHGKPTPTAPVSKQSQPQGSHNPVPDSPPVPPSQWNGPESFATYEVPCPCGKPLKFEFWMFFRCDQTKTVQCSCGKKTERFYNAESGKFGK